jgi:hypothetical protein
MAIINHPTYGSAIKVVSDTSLDGEAGDMINDNFYEMGDKFVEYDGITNGGVVQLSYLGGAPSSLVNGMIWMESDGLHIYRNGAEAIVEEV